MKTLQYHMEHRHATWLELFFDLVFVASIGIVTHNLAHAHDGHIPVKQLLLFPIELIPIWWIWATHTLYANRFDTDGKGCIDVRELKAGFRALGFQVKKAEIRQMFIDMDKDLSSANVTYDEFVEMVTPRMLNRDAREEIMKVFYRKHEGITTILCRNHEEVMKIFHRKHEDINGGRCVKNGDFQSEKQRLHGYKFF